MAQPNKNTAINQLSDQLIYPSPSIQPSCFKNSFKTQRKELMPKIAEEIINIKKKQTDNKLNEN